MKPPVPILVKKGEEYFARWSHDDAMMRSRNRSVLETPDRIDTVDDAFLAALRTDDGRVHWPSADDLQDLGWRLVAWRLDDASDLEACSSFTFRLSPPPSKEDALWKLEVTPPPKTAAGLRALGAACRVCALLRGMTGTTLDLDLSDAEDFLRSGVIALRAAGYRVECPAGLAADLSADVVLSSAASAKEKEAGAESSPVTAKVTIRVAGEVVTRAEIAFLLEQGGSMVFSRRSSSGSDSTATRSAASRSASRRNACTRPSRRPCRICRRTRRAT